MLTFGGINFMKNDDLFNYLVATDKLDEFLGNEVHEDKNGKWTYARFFCNRDKMDIPFDNLNDSEDDNYDDIDNEEEDDEDEYD